jgi:hypothetical protein
LTFDLTPTAFFAPNPVISGPVFHDGAD